MFGLVQSFCTTGLIFGWPALVKILKDEGLYAELCADGETDCSARKTRCLHKREHKVARAPGDTLLLFLLGHPPRFPLTLWLTNQHKSILYTGHGSGN